MRASSFNKKRSVLPARFPYHGGLTPAALDSEVGVRRTLFAVPCKRGRLPTHGGLTPAALVHMRLCIAKGVIFPANERRALRQERGASAPRGLATATAPGFVIAPLTDSRDFAEAYWQVRFPNHGGLTTPLLMRQSVFAEHGSLCSASTACYRPTAG